MKQRVRRWEPLPDPMIDPASKYFVGVRLRAMLLPNPNKSIARKRAPTRWSRTGQAGSGRLFMFSQVSAGCGVANRNPWP